VERYADAARAYLRAVELRPDDFKSNLNLAIAYLELGETRPAASFAVRAVALDPTSGEARATLASAYSEMQLHSDAVREYQAASELMDLRPDLLINMATSLGKLGRYQEMANTLRTVLRLRPSAAAHERLGFAMFKLRRYAEALEQFRRAIDIDPGHYPALNGLGVTLLNQYLRSDKTDIDARDEALSALRRSLRINDRQPRILELVTRYG
jgi:tetratricopeptide (TPR) repeat protein